MGDWKQHLADMQRSRVQHNSDAQQVWLNAYKSSSPEHHPYEKASRKFEKAPTAELPPQRSADLSDPAA